MVRLCKLADTLCEWVLVGKNFPFVSVVELSACGSREPPKPTEELPLSVGFRLPPTAPEKCEKLTFNVIFKQKKFFKKIKKYPKKRLTNLLKYDIIKVQSKGGDHRQGEYKL